MQDKSGSQKECDVDLLGNNFETSYTYTFKVSGKEMTKALIEASKNGKIVDIQA